MNTSMRKFASLVVAALAVPTIAFAAAGTVDLSFSPTTSNVTSPGSSVTLSLSLNVAGFTSPDAVGGVDFLLQSLDLSSGAFFIQSRTTDTSGAFPDPQTPDATVATRPGANLDPTNNNDLGASVANALPGGAQGNGTYHLSNFVIGVDAGVAPGTYTFSTTSNIWTDQNGAEHTDLGPGTFSLVVVPEPATWSLLILGGIGSFGLNFLRARRRAS